MNDDWDADAMDNAALEQDVPLVQCLERGLAGEVEAQQVRGLLAWMKHYELALAEITRRGDERSAQLARDALDGR